jgi:hypothetical protein
MKYPILLLFVLELIEVIRHFYLIEYKKKSPNKVFSFVLRGAWIILILHLAEWHPFWISLGAYVFASWVIHDVGINILRGSPLWYVNGTGYIDKLQRKFEFPAFAWKMIFFIVFVGAYFFNYPV